MEESDHGTSDHERSDHESSDHDAVAEVVAEHVRHALQQGESISVEELGTWRIEHQSSSLSEHSGDRLSVTPPCDHVVFEPGGSEPSSSEPDGSEADGSEADGSEADGSEPGGS